MMRLNKYVNKNNRHTFIDVLKNYFFTILVFFPILLQAQIPNGLDTIYGYEWIQTEQTYFKIQVAEDGLYQLSYDELLAAGIPLSSINSNQWTLTHQGESMPVHVSADGTFQGGDFLAFYGEKNRGDLDQYLYRDAGAQQLNPEYSLISDTAAYYLSWQSESNTDNFTTLNNDLTNPNTPEPYLWKTSTVVLADHFVKERYRFSNANIFYSHFGIGEGFGSRSYNQLLSAGGTTQEVEIPHAPIYTTGPAATLESRYTAGLGNHEQAVSFNNTPAHSASFSSWGMQHFSVPVDMVDFNGNIATVFWEGTANNTDEVSIGYVSLKYPALPSAENMASMRFALNASDNAQYVEISNWSNTSSTVHLFDLTNRIHLIAEQENDLIRFNLPASAEERELLLISEGQFLSTSLEPVDLSIPDVSGVEYLILTNSLLRTGSTDYVQEYVNYRSSMAGGAFQSTAVNVDELYDIFGFGISQHPMAIRNFTHWVLKHNPSFEYLLIVGKGREYLDIRNAQNFADAYGQNYFVPSFGFPASDNLLVSDIDKPTPKVNLGRLPAVSGAEVGIYLSKVQQSEEQINNPQTVIDRAWQKNIMHLGGGSTASEQQSIRNLLVTMENEIETNRFGGQVTAFYKTSSETIQTSTSDLIFDRINDGISLLSFFGHSSAGTFDFNIDNPMNYDNAEKYPMMLSLGCYSGNMFESFRSIGERFIFLENSGANAFAASRGIGFIHALGIFGRQYYTRMGGDFYGESIGAGIRATIATYENSTDIAYGTLAEQFSLQGDPALRLHPAPGPDFTCDASSATFTPQVINVQKDSFSFHVDIYNLGQGIEDSITVKVEQQLPDGSIFSFGNHRISAPRYKETFEITLPTLGRESVGLNSLFIAVDTDGEISELPLPAAENNNQLRRDNGQLGVPLFIIDNAANPIWPPEFALVGENEITLKASTSDVFSPMQKYFLQLDTSLLFNTPLATTTIDQIGGVIEWAPDFNWQDSTVYYWRVSPDSTNTSSAGFVWEMSSFTFIDNIEPGWGQGHWGQWEEGDFDLLLLDEEKEWRFDKDFVNIRIRNKIWNSDDRPGLVYDNAGFAGSVRPWTYLSEGIAAVVYVQDDPNGFWRNPPPGNLFSAGDYGISTGNTRVFAFPTQTTEQRENFLTFLEDVVPEEAYVFLFTVMNFETSDINVDEWAIDSLTTGRNVFQVLESQGAVFARQLEDFGTVPYIFQYRKNLEVIAEVIAPTILGEVNSDFNLALTEPSGTYTSPIIGPTKTWEQIRWQFENQSPVDSNMLIIYAGNDSQHLDSITAVPLNTLNGSLQLANFGISEQTYLQLKWFAYDNNEKNPSQLSYLHVIHENLPDLAINPALTSFSYPDSLQQGAPFGLEISMTNVGNLPVLDTVIFDFVWQDQSGSVLEEQFKVPPLDADESFNWVKNLDTKNTNGNQQLFLELNAPDAPQELYRFNNTGSLLFHLSKDIIAPIVDVTFDGRPILRGDLVSSSPAISIQMEDENPLLALDNPDIFETHLFYPDGSSTYIIPDGVEVIFTTVENTNKNQARLQFQPDFELDGIYRLEIKAKDISENLAGQLLYETSFEVINERQLSNVLPYPNPFTSQTRFVYTLTGDVPIENISIQIMTISGRLVKTIASQELGPLDVGTHQTNYAWDGTDDFGDKLANGTYLYRIVQEGASTDELVPVFGRDNVDGYFSNGIGKVVILR